jgi:hypothetical protein
MKTIQLTPAELELIQVKRQQEELAAQEAAVQNQLAIEKEIARVKLQVEGYIKQEAQQVKAAGEFALQIPSSKLHIDTREHVANVSYKGEVVDTIKYQEQIAHLTIGEHTVSVKEHIVYSKFSYRGSSRGYKMYVSGQGIDYKTANRGYKNTQKVVELIEDTIEEIKAKEAHANKQKNAVATAIAELTQQFPNATIRQERGYITNYHASHSNRYQEYDKLVVTLENGIMIEYRVYESGQLSRTNISFPQHETMELISLLNNMKFPSAIVA